MSELTPTGRVMLGMIRLGRRTGYEIKQLADKSTRYFFAASYGQIYPELRKLEQAGRVRGRQQPSGGRRRRVYELTEAGNRALDDWLDSDREPAFEMRDEALLRLFFTPSLASPRTLEEVRAMRRRSERTLTDFESIHPPPDSGAALVLDYGVAFNRFVVDWCGDVERRLSEQPQRRAAGR